MKAKLRRVGKAVQSVTDRLPGGARRRVMRGRPKPDGLSQGELANLKGYSERQAGLAGGQIPTIGGPGIG